MDKNVIAKMLPAAWIATAILTVIVSPCYAEERMEMGALVPGEVNGWRAEGNGEYFDSEGIFRYMDGAGEVYLSYSFRKLFVRSFRSTGREPVIVELFDMERSADAFGIFSRSRRGEDVGVGQGSEYDSGYLLFWRGRYFAAVYALEENEESKKVVFALGRAIADAIGEDGPLPDLLNLLPDGRLPGSESYFHLHTCLNHHYYIADDNILDLRADTDAAMAAYDGGEGKHFLLLVRYPGSERAASALANFTRAYLPDADESSLSRLENGKWSGARQLGEFLAIVLDAPSRGTAGTALDAIIKKMGEKR